MPVFGDQVTTTAAPAIPSDLLISQHHVTRDAEFKGALTLAVGDVCGFESATGRMALLDAAEKSVAIPGDNSETTFDLDHDSVHGPSLAAYDSNGNLLSATISRGTGADGVDQLVFSVAPASGTTARYQRSTSVPAGVAICAAELAENEEATLAVVVEGTISFDHVQGLPADTARGTQFNALRFA